MKLVPRVVLLLKNVLDFFGASRISETTKTEAGWGVIAEKQVYKSPELGQGS